MKKIIILLTSLMLLVSSCTSINDVIQTKIENEDIQLLVPFLAYYNDSDNKIVAKLSYWDLNSSTINFSEQPIYITPTNNNYVEPIVWDGNKRLVLHKTSLPDNEFKDITEIIENYTTRTIYGRDIKAIKNTHFSEKTGNYQIYLYNEDIVVEKKIEFLIISRDDDNNDIIIGTQEPSYIDYDKISGEITFIFRYPFENHTNIYIAKCNVDNIDKIDWEEIKLSDEIDIFTPAPNNCALVGQKYYIQSYPELAVIDLEKKEAKMLGEIARKCRSIVEEGSFEPPFPKSIAPIGVFEDILILQVPVSTDVNIEYVICAFQNDKLLGAIHLKNDSWNIIDSENNVISEIDVKNKNLYKQFNTYLLVFPFTSNFM